MAGQTGSGLPNLPITMCKTKNLRHSHRQRVAELGVVVVACLALTRAPGALPSETPAKFEPVSTSFDYARREVMIPMRDGVKLHTIIT